MKLLPVAFLAPFLPAVIGAQQAAAPNATPAMPLGYEIPKNMAVEMRAAMLPSMASLVVTY